MLLGDPHNAPISTISQPLPPNYKIINLLPKIELTQKEISESRIAFIYALRATGDLFFLDAVHGLEDGGRFCPIEITIATELTATKKLKSSYQSSPKKATQSNLLFTLLHVSIRRVTPALLTSDCIAVEISSYMWGLVSYLEICRG